MAIELVKIKTSKNWYLRGTLCGVSVYRSCQTDSLKYAEALRVKTEAEILNNHVYGVSAGTTFAQAAHAYLRAGGSPRYLGPVNEALGLRRLVDITQADLDTLARKIYPTAQAQTLNRHVYTPFISVYNYGAKSGYCPERKWRRPKMKRSDKGRAASQEEINKLWWRAGPRLKIAIVLLVYTGLRISEATRLRWQDVDLDKGWLIVHKAKSGHPRGVPLHRAVVETLRRARGAEIEGGAHVLLTPKGNPYTVRKKVAGGQMKTAWNKARRESGVNITPHDLRHTFATWLQEAGIAREMRQDILGHSRSDVHDTYIHVPKKGLIEAVNRLKDFRVSSRVISRIFHACSRRVLPFSALFCQKDIENDFASGYKT